jgi:hypothetical protein
VLSVSGAEDFGVVALVRSGDLTRRVLLFEDPDSELARYVLTVWLAGEKACGIKTEGEA